MKERDFLIIQLYENDLTPKEIMERVSCSEGTIYNVLKRHNIETKVKKIKITKEIEQEIIDSYNNFESIFSISKRTGIYSEKIKEIIFKNKVKPISYSKRENPFLKEDYFEVIDSHEKAYWIGWLITDGNIFGNSITFSLQKKDLYILELLEKDLGLNDKISNISNYVRFNFGCKKMVEDLKKYGIVENKTFTVNIPEIDSKYYPSLLRGCLDGDGSLLIMNSRNKIELELSFTGNIQCVKRFNYLISNLTGLQEKNVTKNGNSVYRVRWSNKEEIIKICTLLYKNCGKHKLDRKYQNYLKIINGDTEITS